MNRASTAWPAKETSTEVTSSDLHSTCSAVTPVRLCSTHIVSDVNRDGGSGCPPQSRSSPRTATRGASRRAVRVSAPSGGVSRARVAATPSETDREVEEERGGALLAETSCAAADATRVATRESARRAMRGRMARAWANGACAACGAVCARASRRES